MFRKLCQNESYSIIYVTEAAAAVLENEIEKYRSLPSPAVILIPGVTGNTGEGLSAVRRSVEKAVGSDIIFALVILAAAGVIFGISWAVSSKLYESREI